MSEKPRYYVHDDCELFVAVDDCRFFIGRIVLDESITGENLFAFRPTYNIAYGPRAITFIAKQVMKLNHKEDLDEKDNN